MSTYSLCFFSQILKSHLFLKWSPHVLPNFRGSPTPGPRPQDAGGIPVPRDAELLPGHGAIVPEPPTPTVKTLRCFNTQGERRVTSDT